MIPDEKAPEVAVRADVVVFPRYDEFAVETSPPAKVATPPWLLVPLNAAVVAERELAVVFPSVELPLNARVPNAALSPVSSVTCVTPMML